MKKRHREHLASRMRGIMDPMGEANARDGKGRNALHRVIRKGLDHRVVNVQIKRGVNVHAWDDDGRTPLHYAVCASGKENVRLLLDAGADVNARDKKGRTPLHDAARSNGNTEVVGVLLDAGSDVNARDYEGATPLAWVLYEGKPEIRAALEAAGGTVFF